MIYQPPPGLALLAYQFGSISKAELEWCLRKWNEKRVQEEGAVKRE